MSVNKSSNSFKSGASTTTAVAAGSSALALAKAITASADRAVSRAKSTRKASSMAVSLVWAAWCKIFRYSLAPSRWSPLAQQAS
jgi:hypothetical protein